ncbi:NADPH-dependent FMN reductase [Paracoccus shanxieyensis]|uniref:NADPH-dependent FMN reductase n=1 Tax=Paracoccus shanxieyensis TaxID=2675752 RepID=A0A6L6ITI0_9RHOB|nr:NAD(P)H-dependent oxidoreductase [Paracoccus shanxieyensis]MTH63473.1 NADPH-dependent FMN reductase [Paracoccus shanxieyensis]MTH86394.1 NADPH-dependent FMN reductase [Paracoccus shanxieyensis]
MTKTVAVIIGSLREDSINRKLTRALEKLAEGKLSFVELNIGALPHYNEDLWETVPAEVSDLKAKVEAADAVLAVTPEYNRSFPGVIKNALDWASRPYGKNSWSGKPAAVTGTSPGVIGAAVAQGHLKAEMLNQNMVVMHQPEAYIHWKADAFADDGSITDEGIRKFLQAYVDAFAAFIEKHG